MASQKVVFAQDQQLNRVDFQIDAEKNGLQRYEVQVQPLQGEFTTQNNTKQAYVEVVEGKEKILVIAPSPHPDIKAIRSAIASNANYELQVFIPGINPKPNFNEKYDLVIYHQTPDQKGITGQIYNELMAKKIPYLVLVGAQTNLSLLGNGGGIMQVNGLGSQKDNVNAVFNQSFANFDLTPELQSLLNTLPPVSVPFSRTKLLGASQPLLYQKIGSIATKKVLLAVNGETEPKGAIMLGEGLWRWKLQEYARNDNNDGFNELITKMVQFLSSKEDKRKFKVYPLANEFNSAEPVVFDTEVYNDLYERVYGNKIDLVVTDEEGEAKSYTFVANQSNTQYKVSGLPQGVYRYSATTNIGGTTERASGQFVVKTLQVESINLTADFGLLRKLAQNTGNSFYQAKQTEVLSQTLAGKAAAGIIHTSESFLPLVNLKWLFFLLLGLVSAEWFIRKYNGSY